MSRRSTDIARTFLPNRNHYWYTRCKLASDPLYAGVGAALHGPQAPLLDLGCGIGLLAHTLRAQGFDGEYLGVDNDAEKIAAAGAAAARACLHSVKFVCIDLARDVPPAHRGSVTLLDVLQYVSPQAGEVLIERAAACIAPGARLVIRTGLEDGSARLRFTRAIDKFAKGVGWMNAAPHWYPTRRRPQRIIVKSRSARNVHAFERRVAVQQLAGHCRARDLKLRFPISNSCSARNGVWPRPRHVKVAT